jgi:hypothetical protein
MNRLSLYMYMWSCVGNLRKFWGLLRANAFLGSSLGGGRELVSLRINGYGLIIYL